MKYFFILGNNPTLSVAEISAVFDLKKNFKIKAELLNNNVFILDGEDEVDVERLIKNIGGTIKIGEIVEEVDDEKDIVVEKCLDLIRREEKTKIKFGISFYGKKRFDYRKNAMQIKELLKNEEVEARWVSSKDTRKPLSSVTVDRNKLIKKGIELILVKKGEKMLIGKTLAVQPFQALSFRDYNRPSRDSKSGMIPPKLAQIMLNLGVSAETPNSSRGGNKIIYDAFCGSGTILTEAILMGHKTVIGSDISVKAIKNAKDNINWIIDEYKLEKINSNIFVYDSQQISQYLKKRIVDAVVSEPYLGPQRGKLDISRVKRDLERLYANSLAEFEKILKPNGRVVMIWPIFKINGKLFKISPKLETFKIIRPVPKFLSSNESIKLTDRNTIIYGRKGQRVWREIVVLKVEK